MAKPSTVEKLVCHFEIDSVPLVFEILELPNTEHIQVLFNEMQIRPKKFILPIKMWCKVKSHFRLVRFACLRDFFIKVFKKQNKNRERTKFAKKNGDPAN